MYFVVSIPGSGTRAVEKHFDAHGFCHPSPEGVIFGADATLEECLRLARYCTLLTPLRDPFDIASTWRRRGLNLHWLPLCYDMLRQLPVHYVSLEGIEVVR